jgi:hypothetical protein
MPLPSFTRNSHQPELSVQLSVSGRAMAPLQSTIPCVTLSVGPPVKTVDDTPEPLTQTQAPATGCQASPETDTWK